MPFFTRFSLLWIPVAALAGCASPLTVDEIVPVYESPCAVYDAGDAACGAEPDEHGSYAAAWSALPCTDVCAVLDTEDPSPLVACEPVHLALPNDGEKAGFYVATCTFDEEGSP